MSSKEYIIELVFTKKYINNNKDIKQKYNLIQFNKDAQKNYNTSLVGYTAHSNLNNLLKIILDYREHLDVNIISVYSNHRLIINNYTKVNKYNYNSKEVDFEVIYEESV